MFLSQNNIQYSSIRDIKDFQKQVPQLSKENYINKYTLAERCVQGQLPRTGSLDESAGTSGSPTNWIRSDEEEKSYLSLNKISMTYLFRFPKNKKYVLINGFILGSWAGSQRFSSRMGRFGIMKNTGPDSRKILQCIREFGLEYTFLISGYPPFLKEMVEYGKQLEEFDWKDFDVHLLTGGEGFVEEWRSYVLSHFREGATIYSIYGAIDLDVGIAMETPLSVALRGLMDRDREFSSKLLGTDRTPCFLGQYSPFHFHIQEAVNEKEIKELETTLLNFQCTVPMIKYNIGDEGGVVPFLRMKEILINRGYDFEALVETNRFSPVVPYPFLYLYGRSDGTVTINGALISPNDIYKIILSDVEMNASIRNFKLSVEMDEAKTIRLFIYLEARAGAFVQESTAKRFGDVIISKMLESNPCFRIAYTKSPDKSEPVVRVFPFQAGPFAGDKERIKIRYILE